MQHLQVHVVKSIFIFLSNKKIKKKLKKKSTDHRRHCDTRACAVVTMEEARLLVAVRPRLLAPFEPSDAGLSFCGEDDTVQLSGVEKTEALSFDRVFGPTASNEDVFAGVAAPIVAAVMRGVNGAVAACASRAAARLSRLKRRALAPPLQTVRRALGRLTRCEAQQTTPAWCHERCAARRGGAARRAGRLSRRPFLASTASRSPSPVRHQRRCALSSRTWRRTRSASSP